AGLAHHHLRAHLHGPDPSERDPAHRRGVLPRVAPLFPHGPRDQPGNTIRRTAALLRTRSGRSPGMTFDISYALEVLPTLLAALKTTVAATFYGTGLALVLGLVWALGRRSRSGWIARPAAIIVEFVRSTPLIVQIYFLFYVLPIYGVSAGPFLTGVLALGLHYSTYMAEVYRAGIEGVPRGQWEAAEALNLTRGQLYRHVVLPQAIPPVIPAL